MPGEVAAAGIGAIGQLINAGLQGIQNKKQREWNEKMYGIQRADALADWARSNEYNSPLAQMQRFKEAGLNPNLIYGQTNTAQPVRSTDVKSWNPQAPAFNLGQIVDQYLQTKQAGASIDVMKEQKKKVMADTEGQLINNIKNAKGLPYIEMQAEAKLQNMYADTELKQANIGLALGRNAREAIRSTDDHEIAVQRALNIQKDTLLKSSQIQNNGQQFKNLQETQKILIEEGNLKKLDRMWREVGLTKNSTRLEWLTAQFIMDPANANEKLQGYIKALGQLATSGARQTGQTIAETASTLWDYWFGKD